jgi:2-polyprenyl-3-methyl-5-hydroxy-6-metoxy-1,4-benzoquinol methylase
MFPNCACGTQSFDRIRSIRGIGGKSVLLRCSSCGLYRWQPPADFSRGYSPKEYKLGGRAYFDATPEQEKSWANDILSTNSLGIARRIARLYQESIKLLDCGCAFGHLLGSIRTLKPDWELQGVEINPAYVSFARRCGFTVHEGEISEVLARYDSDFDVIVLTEVLEHLDNPSRVLTHVRQSLKDGAYVVLTVPNLQALVDLHLLRERSSLSIPYQHLWFFTTQTLSNLLRASGFETVDCRTLSLYAGKAKGFRHYLGKLANIILDMTRFGTSIFFIGRRL